MLEAPAGKPDKLSWISRTLTVGKELTPKVFLSFPHGLHDRHVRIHLQNNKCKKGRLEDKDKTAEQ